jgi:hypothetical protein
VGSGLCEELITRPEEFYQLHLIRCDRETSIRRPRPERDDVPEAKYSLHIHNYFSQSSIVDDMSYTPISSPMLQEIKKKYLTLSRQKLKPTMYFESVPIAR